MQVTDIDDMRKRPPHRLDVLVNAVYGDDSPTLFRPGKYYTKGDNVYTYTEKGDITVWKCEKSGTYDRAMTPGWSEWSLDDLRDRLSEIESILKNNYDIYETYSYPLSYYIHDVGVRDWEHRGSYMEVFNNKKYVPKKKYQIVDEQVVPADGEELSSEIDAELWLNKSNNKAANLVRRIELEGTKTSSETAIIPFPADEELMFSYFYDLFVDGVYISPKFINEYTNDEGAKCVELKFNTDDVEDPALYKLETGELTYVKPVDPNSDSEFIFVFYVSISHDLTIAKEDINVFIGNEKDRKWISTGDIKITNNFQEVYVYNNGIRLRADQYAIAKDRIGVDKEEDRFALGSYATVSVRTFTPVVEDKVSNVKQETVPMYGTSMGLLAIPFLNYDEDTDHFLLFNDGGILLGSQRWFEDNGYVNLYDDNLDIQPNEMAEFRMISRDKNMVVTTYILTAREDGQPTFTLPVVAREHYFHMIFTESGQFFSRTKYALSGNLMQIRQKYRKDIKAGDRFEIMFFDYSTEYGFTSLTNYQSFWNTDYVEVELDTYDHGENDELETDEDPKPDETDIDINDLTYDPIVNPNFNRLQYIPTEAPGSRCIFVQDKAITDLHSSRYDSSMSYVTGIDCDHQIIVSTSEGDIIRFDRTGAEDTRYNLKQCSLGGGRPITVTETDDFGNTYYISGSVLGKGHTLSRYVVDEEQSGYEDNLWELEMDNDDWVQIEPYMKSMKSITYVDGWLYLEYTRHNLTSYRVARINPDNGSMTILDLGLDKIRPGTEVYDEDGNLTSWKCYYPKNAQTHRARMSKYANKIYLGSIVYIDDNGNPVDNIDDGKPIFRLYEVDMSTSSDNRYPVQCGVDLGVETSNTDDLTVSDVIVGKEHVVMIVDNATTFQTCILKYNISGDDANKMNVSTIVTDSEDVGNVLGAMDADDNVYIFNEYTTKLTKYDATTLEPIWEYGNGETEFADGVTECRTLFVDSVDYHVYMHYIANNKEDRYRYLELEQNELPIPLYKHVTVLNSTQSATKYLPATPARDLSWRMPSTNRYYIGGRSGNIFTFTQSGRELTKREQDGSLRINGNKFYNENDAEQTFIIPDDEYNYYVISKNIITKFNRYDRIVWEWDGDGIVSSISDRFAYNHSTQELVFFYYDTTGMQGFAKITSKGDFSVLSFALPNGVPIEKTDAFVAVDNAGAYYIAFTAMTIYRYSRNMEYQDICYGTNTDKLLAGPVGDIVISGIQAPQALYVSERDDSSGVKHSRIYKYNGGTRGMLGTVDTHLIWKHDFLNSSQYARMAIDDAYNVYMCDGREIRKLDEYGNYIWRFVYDEENIRIEPDHILVDEFYRVFFMDSDGSVHRIDQYDLTLNPVPDEEKEPTEPKVETPEDSTEVPENYIKVQRTFDIPFEYDENDSAMLLFTNTGQYIGNRFWELKRGKIHLKGAPIYENGWLDIIRIKNERESVIV